MSSRDVPPEIAERAPSNYTGAERYWRAFEDWYEVRLSPEQRRICEHVAENQYTHLEGGNGFGKTFAIVALSLAFHRRHYPSSVVVTSGTYGKLKRTFCADAENLHGNSPFVEDSAYWPRGEWKWSPNPHIDVEGEPTWQFEVHSPEDPGELEGVHNDYTLVIVDEADKKDVDLDMLDSMDSIIGDRNDRMVVISNPPDDETNAVANMGEIGVDAEKLQLSTFDSHNVQVELDRRDGERVPGLTGLHKLRKKWEALNGEPWPGYEAARAMSTPGSEEWRTDLDERWYRRFAGVMPPASASKHRPFYTDDVRDMLEVDAPEPPGSPIAVGIDMARKGGDSTVTWTLYPETCRYETWTHTDHGENERKIKEILDGYPSPHTTPIAIDATGEGSGVADRLRDAYGAIRFKASEKAVDDEDWDNKWTEAMHHLGQHVPQLAMGDVAEREVRDELFTAARVVEYELRDLKSGDVLRASPKAEIKAELGRSPDHLDAFAQACWAAGVDHDDTRHVTRKRSGTDKRGRRRIER